MTIDQLSESDVGEYRCIANLLADLMVYKSNYASLTLLGFIGQAPDVVVKRDEVPIIPLSVRLGSGVDVTCTLSTGLVEMSEVGLEGSVVEYEGVVSEIPSETTDIPYHCQVTYSGGVTMLSSTASIAIIGIVTLIILDSLLN